MIIREMKIKKLCDALIDLMIEMDFTTDEIKEFNYLLIKRIRKKNAHIT